MRTTLFCVGLCAAFLSVVADAKADTILDFEGLEAAGNSAPFWADLYSEDGFTIDNLDSDGAHAFFSYGLSNLSYAGSTGLVINPAGSTVRLSRSTGDPFSISSIDLAPAANFPDPMSASVTFYGHTVSGGVVDVTFTVSRGSALAQPPLVFQTFSFVGAGWQNLTHLEWDQGSTPLSGHQFDQIVLGPANPVPEPTTLALFGLGAGALALRRRKRRLA